MSVAPAARAYAAVQAVVAITMPVEDGVFLQDVSENAIRRIYMIVFISYGKDK